MKLNIIVRHENMCAVIFGFIMKINQLLLTVCCESTKGMTDNRLEISEVIVQQNLFFPQAFNLFSSNFVHDKLFSGCINNL